MKTYLTTTLILWVFGATAQINEIVDSLGDGGENGLEAPRAVITDSQGNLYISGSESNNVFRLDANADCLITNAPCQWVEIMDDTGAGIPNQELMSSRALAVDSQDHLYVVGRFSDNVWRINNPQVCSSSDMTCDLYEIIDTNGDGTHDFNGPYDVEVDHMDNVYVTGTTSNNIFRIAASPTCDTQTNPCTITEVVDSTGTGSNGLFQPGNLAIDEFGNVFSSNFGDNVLMISTPGACSTNLGNCQVTKIFDEDDFDSLELGIGLEVDHLNNVFVSSYLASTGASIYRLDVPDTCVNSGQSCLITEIYHGAAPQQASELVADDAGNLFIAGGNADNVTRIKQAQNCSLFAMDCEVTEVINATGDGTAELEGVLTLTVFGRDILVPGFTSDNAFNVLGVAELSDLIFKDDFE